MSQAERVPIGAMWVASIRMTVVPLVFGLIVSGIAQSQDSGALGKVGLRAVAVFVVLLSLVALMTGVVAPLWYSGMAVDAAAAAALQLSASQASAQPDLPGFAAWLTSLVPVNPVRSAADGAMLPLVVFAVAFGLALRGIDKGLREAIAAFFGAVADAMLVIVRWVLRASPLGIAALAISLGARVGVGAAGAVGFYLVTHCAILIVAIGMMYPAAALFGRVPLGAFARAIVPAQLVAMSARSSIAALPAMLEASDKLRIPRDRSAFVVPFAVSVFRLNVAVSWIVGALFVAKLYGVPLSVTALLSVGAAAVAMSFSVPGIPSGSLFIFAPVLQQVGLPVEGVGILIALDAIPDVFKTTLNVTSHMTATVVAARERD